MVLKMTMIMKLSLISSCCILLEGRLVEKSAEKITTTPEPDLVKSTLYHRVARDVGDGYIDISNEMESSNENLKDNYKSAKYFMKSHEVKSSQVARGRVVRESDQHYADYEKSNTNKSIPETTTEKKVLIRKPIPKFYELDSENDFQKNADAVNLKLVDSGADHEDEDFNVGDYDFDVNHDEYAGRERHLEPRLKKIENKILHEHDEVKSTLVVPLPPAGPDAEIPPHRKHKVKREYPFVNTNKPYVKKDDDYSDESSTTVPVTVTKESNDDDDYEDSNKEGDTTVTSRGPPSHL